MAISIDRPEDVTAKAPVLSTADASGGEDTAIALDIAAALSDPDGSEALSITVSGVPQGAVLSAGMDNGDGSWSLAPADLEGLTIAPPADSDADFQLTVTAAAAEGANGETATTTGTIDVTVGEIGRAHV